MEIVDIRQTKANINYTICEYKQFSFRFSFFESSSFFVFVFEKSFEENFNIETEQKKNSCLNKCNFCKFLISRFFNVLLQLFSLGISRIRNNSSLFTIEL